MISQHGPQILSKGARRRTCSFSAEPVNDFLKGEWPSCRSADCQGMRTNSDTARREMRLDFRPSSYRALMPLARLLSQLKEYRYEIIKTIHQGLPARRDQSDQTLSRRLMKQDAD
jgi:hypothetical protein